VADFVPVFRIAFLCCQIISFSWKAVLSLPRDQLRSTAVRFT
jgi:hypothetical protein